MHIYSVTIDVIRGCWLTFAIVWLLAAVWTKRSVYRESRSQRLCYTLPIVAAYFLLINGGRMLYPLNLRVVPHTAIAAWAGMIFGVAVARHRFARRGMTRRLPELLPVRLRPGTLET